MVVSYGGGGGCEGGWVGGWGDLCGLGEGDSISEGIDESVTNWLRAVKYVVGLVLEQRGRKDSEYFGLGIFYFLCEIHRSD